jgi:hypothetical protein
MGRSLFFSNVDVKYPEPMSSHLVLNTLKSLKNDDVVEIVEMSDYEYDYDFLRSQSSYYMEGQYMIKNIKFKIEKIDCDCVHRNDEFSHGVRAIKLVPLDDEMKYVVEYLTTDGYIREIESCGISGYITQINVL